MKVVMILVAALSWVGMAWAAVPAPTYMLPFDAAYNQSAGAQTFAWSGQFATQGTNFQLVPSPLGKAMQGYGEGPYTYNTFNYGWSWTLNLRLKTVNKEKGIILSLGNCGHNVNPGLAITTDNADGIELKVVKGKSTIMDSCKVNVANATTAYHDYTLIFTYNRSTQQGEINAYADAVWKGKVAITIAPYFTGAQGIQLFGIYNAPGSSTCTYGSSAAPETSIEDFRFWRDQVFTAEQVSEIHAQNLLAMPTSTPYYHWTFESALNDQSGTATLNFSSGLSHTLKDGVIEGKGEGPYWVNCFNLSGSWTWLMRLKTINAEKSCICSLGWCSQAACGVLAVTDGDRGIKLLSVKNKNTVENTLAVAVPDATTAFHDYAFVYLEGSATLAVFVDGCHQGELPISTTQFNAGSTVQLFGQCGGIGSSCTYNNPGSQIADLQVFRHTGRALVWNGSQLKPNWRLSAANDNWFAANGDAVFFGNGDSVTFDDSAAVTSVLMSQNVTASTVTIDNTTKDYAFDGTFALYGTGAFTKRGTGTVTWGPVGLLQRSVIDIQAGVFRMNTAVANMFGTSGEVLVADGAQFDLHNVGGANVASPVLAKTFRVAGAGPDGNGAIVNSGNNNAGPHLGDVVLEGDATIGGAGRIDLRTAGKGITGADKTLTVKNTSVLDVAGGKIAVGAIAVAAGAHLQYEAGTIEATTLSLPAGAFLRCSATLDFAGMISGSGTVELENGASFAFAPANLRPALTVLNGNSTVTVATPDKTVPMFSSLQVPAGSALTIALNGASGFAAGDSFALTTTAVNDDSFSRIEVAFAGNDGLQATTSRNGDGILMVTVAAAAARDLVWSAAGGVWDRGTTANWTDRQSGNAMTFINGSTVTFDDTGAAAATLGMNVSPSRVEFTNSTLDYTMTGACLLSAANGLVKSGTGTLNWGDAYVSASTPIVVSNGVLKLNTTTADIFGNSGTITVEDRGQFDLNNQAAGGSTSPVVNKTFRIAGTGPDGEGAIVNRGTLNYGYHLGNVELLDDATIGGAGRIDLRTSGKGIVGAGKTLTVKSALFAVIGGAKIDVGTINVVTGGLFRIEPGYVVTANEILLNGGTYESYASSDNASISTPAPLMRVVSDSALNIIRGRVIYENPFIVESGKTLSLTSYANSSSSVGHGYDTHKPVDNAGTIEHTGGYWGHWGLINRAGAVVIHDSPDIKGVKSYSAITNNGVIWVKQTGDGDQKINYAECPIYGTGDMRLTGGWLRLNGNHMTNFAGRVIYGGGKLSLSSITGGSTALAGAPWQFVVEAGAEYSLPLTVPAGVDFTTLAPIVGRKIDAQGKFKLPVTMSELRNGGRWKLTNTGDYAPADIANWEVEFGGVEGQKGRFNVVNGNVYLNFGPSGLVIYMR